MSSKSYLHNLSELGTESENSGNIKVKLVHNYVNPILAYEPLTNLLRISA